MGHKTYESLYESKILSIANYSSAVWGYKEHHGSRVLFNKIGRFYLGTYTFMPTAALYLELDWQDIRHTRWLEILRYKNRVIKMPEHRWPSIVWNCSLAKNEETWCHDV